jgi:guanine nucleotide-binding protein subunit alpha
MELAKQKNVVIPNADKLLEIDTLNTETAQIIQGLTKIETFNTLLQKDGDSLGLQGGISGTEFLFNNAVRIADDNYKPTDDDTCWARSKTTGIDSVEVDVCKGLKVTVYDIGGQRSERKKWPKLFNNVGIVIYMCALNEYDMVLEEDNKKNRLHESLKIWEKLTKSPHFVNCSFFLLFNKCDIFEKKIVTKPLGDIFTNYPDFAKGRAATETEFEKSWRYIEDLFKKRFSGKVPFETFATNSTDKENFNRAWDKIAVYVEKLYSTTATNTTPTK